MGSSANGSDQTATPARAWWQGVEVRHLAALAALAREGSFRAAAESLGYVQSAVSQQLSQLEALVGRRLVVRRRGSARVALTEAGKLLLSHADEIMARLGAAYADLDALNEDEGPSLRVGVPERVEVHLMPRILPPLLRRLPGLSVTTVGAPEEGELLELLEAGRVDAAFGIGPGLAPQFVSIRLLTEPFLLVVPAGSELAVKGGAPDRGELASLELIGHDLMPDLEQQLRRAGVSPRTSVRARSYAAVQALVAAGVGAAILPALAVDERDLRVACLPLDRFVLPGALSLAWQRGRQIAPALRHFVEVADRTVQAMEKELAERHAAPPRGVARLHAREDRPLPLEPSGRRDLDMAIGE